MPSQEDYLDQLLKGIVDESVAEGTAVEEIASEKTDTEGPVIQEPALDVPELDADEDILKKMVLENATIEDVLSDADEEEFSEIMSADEIEQILTANNTQSVPSENVMEIDTDEDLMSLLEESSDGELQDIYDMLHKSDNNELVDDEMFSSLQGDLEVDEASKLQALLDGEDETAEQETPVASERQQKAAEKKRLKEEKAAAKRAAKEAKKAAKEAQKAAKKAAKETARENAEAAANSNEAAESDVFEGIDELSTADMLDLQDLLSVGEIQSSSEDAIAQLQQDAKPQSKPVVVDVPESAVAPGGAAVDEAVSADMLEIDELLSLAGISGISEEDTAEIGSVDTSVADILMVDENDIQDLIPEKEKKSLFARIIDFLTETDEDEEGEKGTEDIPLSDENKNILEEMDNEAKTSGKKGKKKAKKGKKAQAEFETLDEEGEASAEIKGKKVKKAKKPRKEKEQHVKVMPLEDSKSKLPVKVMISVAAACASILAVVLIFANLGGDFAAKREAKKAYYREDYETCYKALYGKKLNESEQVMFSKSESILRINLRMREYEIFAAENSEVEALDVLIQTAHDYAQLYEYASKWNAGEEVSAVYSRILGILQEKYNLTEAAALEIAAEPDDVEYTRIVTDVAAGMQYSSSNEAIKTEHLPDMLPEEQQFPENNGGQ